MTENKTLEIKKEEPKVIEIPKPVPPAISLNELKPQNTTVINSNDRSAGADKMNALKNLITEKTEQKKTEMPAPTPSVSATPKPVMNDVVPKPPIKEVPEEVLKGLLE
ncbi:hypothetical protein K8Q94_00825 [Candidatus Nomurabacteria bacterium]|nr:hypothetical protein [Candidatus Nomurabacteria bacterium]